MASLMIHGMDTAWASSNGALLSAQVDTEAFVEGLASNLVQAPSGAQGEWIEIIPAQPLDLSARRRVVLGV